MFTLLEEAKFFFHTAAGERCERSRYVERTLLNNSQNQTKTQNLKMQFVFSCSAPQKAAIAVTRVLPERGDKKGKDMRCTGMCVHLKLQFLFWTESGRLC